MELNYLKDFVLLAEVQHFQNAADMLFISQSTLSKHIKSIEAELGQDLFIRSHKRTELSDFGRLFLPYARQILNIQEEYTDQLLQDLTTDNRVAFGCTPMVTLYNFMEFFTGYMKKKPSVQYNIIQGSSERLLTLLQRKNVDFILADDISLPEKDFQKILYTRDSLVAILPAEHPLASHKNVSIKELETENLITFSNLMNAEHYLKRLYPDSNFQTTITVEKESLLFDLIRRGLGVSVMTNWASVHYAVEGTLIKEITPRPFLDIYMIYQKNRKLSSLTKALAAYLKNKR